MKRKVEIVYGCDFCKKVSFHKGVMTLHERQCKRNPKNMHKCFQYCMHLVKDSEYVPLGWDYGDTRTTFHCDLNPSVILYSYKLERFIKNKKRCENMTRMPLQCDQYQIEGCHDENYPAILYK